MSDKTKVRAKQTINITLSNRTIEAKEGETYEFTEEELMRIPLGYFEPIVGEQPPEEAEKKTKKTKKGE